MTHGTILPGEAELHAQVMTTIGVLMGVTTLAHIVDALAEHCSGLGDAMEDTSKRAADDWNRCAALLMDAAHKIKDHG